MKSILEYQKEYWYKQSFIMESFKSSILRDIKDQINDIIEANHEYNSENKYSRRTVNASFKSIFSRKDILWSDITDDDFKKYNINDEKTDKELKRITSNRKNSYPAIIVIFSGVNDPKYSGVIISNGGNNEYFSLLQTNYFFSMPLFRPSDYKDYIKNDILVLELKDFWAIDKRRERWENQTGAFNVSNNKENRDMMYKRMIENNRERYKKYVAKVRAEKDANDGMSDKVNEYSKKILDIVSDISKKPADFIKFQYEVGYLLDLLNDKRRYISSSRGQGYYSGTDGLLTLYKSYITTKLAVSGGNSYEHQQREYNAAKTTLDKMFKEIDSRIDKFNEKISA